MHIVLADVQRQPGQGGAADTQKRDLRAQLLQAEAAHFSKNNDGAANADDEGSVDAGASKRRLEDATDTVLDEDEEIDAKRRRVLEETRDIDADSDGSEDDESSSEER